MIKPQSEFPLLETYRGYFPITDKTIFAYDKCIYSNYALTPDLLVHEIRHIWQQEKHGLENWVRCFLEVDKFRLEMEIDAYKEQLRSIKDREKRNKIRIECSEKLSSPLYGDIITKSEAFALLKV